MFSHWGHARLYAHLCYAVSKSNRLSHIFTENKNTTNFIELEGAGSKRLATRNARERSTRTVTGKRREASKNGRVIAWFRLVTSRAEGIQIEERSMTLEICIAINNARRGCTTFARIVLSHVQHTHRRCCAQTSNICCASPDTVAIRYL